MATPNVAEEMRRLLNRSIDILHQLSSKKVSEEVALSAARALHEEGFERQMMQQALSKEQSKECRAQFEIFITSIQAIISDLAKRNTPLYEAIMAMNKAVVNRRFDSDAKSSVRVRSIFDESTVPTLEIMRQSPDVVEPEGADLLDSLSRMTGGQFDPSFFAHEHKEGDYCITKVKEKTVPVGEGLEELFSIKQQLNEKLRELNKKLADHGFAIVSTPHSETT